MGWLLYIMWSFLMLRFLLLIPSKQEHSVICFHKFSLYRAISLQSCSSGINMKRWLQLWGRLDISNSISRLGRPRKPPFVFLGMHLVCAVREKDNRYVCIKLSVHKVVKSLCLWIFVSWKRFYPSLHPCTIPKNLSLTWKNKITAITVET